jgi:glycosyltransferase involved in cell wall biosynthesis
MSTRKKILIVNKNIPYPPYTGGDVRVYNLIKRVAQRHEVSLICLSDRKLIKNTEALRKYVKEIHVVPIITDRSKHQKFLLLFNPAEWHRMLKRAWLLLKGRTYANACFYHPDFVKELKQVLTGERFDLIQFEFFVTGQYLSDIKKLVDGAKTILVQHGLWAEELRRMIDHSSGPKKPFYRIELFFTKRYEASMLKRFDHVIAMSTVDKDKMITWGIPENKFTVIKSGVAIEEFVGIEKPELNHHIVFIGTMKYLPNREGLGWFLDSIFPLIKSKVKQATVVVIGEKKSDICRKYEGQPVRFVGVIDDLESEMGKGAVFITPLHIGTGTRLKIVTAMAFGMPVVSTSVGIEGIDAGEDKGSIVVDTEQEFADAVTSLLLDNQRRSQLGANARNFVEKEYSWDVISADLCSLYDKLLKENNPYPKRR